jgi:hypothetical protein
MVAGSYEALGGMNFDELLEVVRGLPQSRREDGCQAEQSLRGFTDLVM